MGMVVSSQAEMIIIDKHIEQSIKHLMLEERPESVSFEALKRSIIFPADISDEYNNFPRNDIYRNSLKLLEPISK